MVSSCKIPGKKLSVSVKGGVAVEDEKIIELFWQRNEQAISAAQEQYGIYCKSIAVSILENAQDAEECLNDTVLSLWNSIPPNHPRSLRAYMGKIIRNLALNRYRAMQRQKRGSGNMPLLLDELSEVVSERETVEQILDSRALTEALQDFLRQLPKNQRVMFVRRYWYADPVGTLAEAFGISENSLSVKLHRMRQKLKLYLQERGFDL